MAKTGQRREAYGVYCFLRFLRREIAFTFALSGSMRECAASGVCLQDGAFRHTFLPAVRFDFNTAFASLSASDERA